MSQNKPIIKSGHVAAWDGHLKIGFVMPSSDFRSAVGGDYEQFTLAPTVTKEVAADFNWEAMRAGTRVWFQHNENRQVTAIALAP